MNSSSATTRKPWPKAEAEAAVEKAKAILAANQLTAVELERTMTDGNQQYTRNIGGVFSAKTEAEFLLKEAGRAIPFEEMAVLEWLEQEASKLGFEI